MGLELDDSVRKKIYEKVKLITAHADLYFSDHVFPVAKMCFSYSHKFLATGSLVDPVVCELAGLFHDVGYTADFEKVEGDHIQRGCQIAPNILADYGISDQYISQIVDCIWTHDGNLHRSRFAQNGQAPLENIIVNDVDSMMLFEWPINSVISFINRLKPEKNTSEIVSDIIYHAEQTLDYIHHPYFKELAAPKYALFVSELKKRVEDGD